MKYITYKIFHRSSLDAGAVPESCKDILEEQPRSYIYTWIFSDRNEAFMVA